MDELTTTEIYKLGCAFHRGALSEKLLMKICKSMNYNCIIDDAGGVMITLKLVKR